jgi:hypothetical protein
MKGIRIIKAKRGSWKFGTWTMVRSKAKRLAIPMHAPWAEDMEAFWEGVGERPSVEHRLTLKAKGPGYVPGNVEWRKKFDGLKAWTPQGHRYVYWRNIHSQARKGAFPLDAIWAADMEAFWSAVGERPSPAHHLKRKVKELGFVPGNVEWKMIWKSKGKTL